MNGPRFVLQPIIYLPSCPSVFFFCRCCAQLFFQIIPFKVLLDFFNELPLLTSNIMNKNCIKFHLIFYKEKFCRYSINNFFS